MDAEVFIYTGAGAEVPDDVVRVRVDPSVTSIPAEAFQERNKLSEVELCEGLVEIGKCSFGYCDQSITKINIPNSLRRINDWAFNSSLRTPIRLHDGIESIGEHAFSGCIFTNFRVPPLTTVIPKSILSDCMTMFSLELSERISEIKGGALACCYSLRNVAIPPNAIFGNNVIIIGSNGEMADLFQLFGSDARIIRELMHRFDGLPIHRIVYYQSYHHGVLQNLFAAINMRSDQCQTLRSVLNPTGNQQDCLGMTPLHILACSSIHDIEIYLVIVEKYPANLITEDRWGALPLLYAFLGAAPTEIIQFLLDSYQSIYPDYVFNWTNMVETMGRTDTPKERIENLLCVKQMHFPDQQINWDYLLDEFMYASSCSVDGALYRERMQFLVMYGMSDRVEALAFKVWRNHITNMIHTADFKWGYINVNYYNLNVLHRIRAKVAHFEDNLPKLKEITTILELALWKLRMNEKLPREEVTRPRKKGKKEKTDESSGRQHSRVTCGADVVIGHVLPYLLMDEYSESGADDDDDDSESSEGE